MAEDSDLERTEPASSRKIEQAREQGNVPYSRELSTFAIFMAGAVTFAFIGTNLYQGMRDMMHNALTFNLETVADPALMTRSFTDASLNMLIAFAPLGLALLIAALVANILVTGWMFSSQALQPKFDRINPIKGIQRIFSWQGFSELVKAILKSGIIAGMAGWMLWIQREDLMNLAAEPLEAAVTHAIWIMLWTLLAAGGAFALIAMADVPFQIWQYYRGLRMTKEEVRQEHKQTEGDPHLKARIRQIQRETARRRMMAEVPKAEVVVTNPTHYAVALKYDEKRMSAPQVVAKGSQLVAERIKEIARENRVPIIEAPPLARALHRHVEIGDAIPNTLFTAVAQVLAYVYQLKQPELSPALPSDWQVPADLDPGQGRA